MACLRPYSGEARYGESIIFSISALPTTGTSILTISVAASRSNTNSSPLVREYSLLTDIRA